MAYIEREVERSIPELKIGNLLTNKEIRQIVKERTFYADRKFKFLKHDYLRYIQFETKLFRLIMLRSQTKISLVFYIYYQQSANVENMNVNIFIK